MQIDGCFIITHIEVVVFLVQKSQKYTSWWSKNKWRNGSLAQQQKQKRPFHSRLSAFCPNAVFDNYVSVCSQIYDILKLKSSQFNDSNQTVFLA